MPMINRLFLTLILWVSILSQPYQIEVVDPPIFGTVSLVDGTSITYSTEEDVDKFVLDSFAVRTVDTLDNISKKSILYILIVPEFKLNVYPLGNPLVISGNSVELVNPQMYEDFNLSLYDTPREGIAIVLDSDRELNVYDSRGTVKIFDSVGNLIYESDMKFLSYNNKSYGVIVWDGRNINRRVVASGSYVVFINAEVVTTDNPTEYDNVFINSNRHHKILKTFVGVKIQ